MADDVLSSAPKRQTVHINIADDDDVSAAAPKKQQHFSTTLNSPRRYLPVGKFSDSVRLLESDFSYEDLTDKIMKQGGLASTSSGNDPPNNVAFPVHLFDIPLRVAAARNQHQKVVHSFHKEVDVDSQLRLNRLFTTILAVGRRALRSLPEDASQIMLAESMQRSISLAIDSLKFSDESLAEIEEHIAQMEYSVKLVQDCLLLQSGQPLLASESASKAAKLLHMYESIIPKVEKMRRTCDFSLSNYIFDLICLPEVFIYYHDSLSDDDWRLFHKVLLLMKEVESATQMQVVMPWQIRKREEFREWKVKGIELLECAAMATHDDIAVISTLSDLCRSDSDVEFHKFISSSPRSRDSKANAGRNVAMFNRVSSLWAKLRSLYPIAVYRVVLTRRFFSSQKLTRLLTREVEDEQLRGKKDMKRFVTLQKELQAQSSIIRAVEDQYNEEMVRLARETELNAVTLAERRAAFEVTQKLAAVIVEKDVASAHVRKLKKEAEVLQLQRATYQQQIEELTSRILHAEREVQSFSLDVALQCVSVEKGTAASRIIGDTEEGRKNLRRRLYQLGFYLGAGVNATVIGSNNNNSEENAKVQACLASLGSQSQPSSNYFTKQATSTAFLHHPLSEETIMTSSSTSLGAMEGGGGGDLLLSRNSSSAVSVGSSSKLPVTFTFDDDSFASSLSSTMHS